MSSNPLLNEEELHEKYPDSNPLSMDFSLSWVDASDASMDDLEVHITMLKSRIDRYESFLVNHDLQEKYEEWLDHLGYHGELNANL